MKRSNSSSLIPRMVSSARKRSSSASRLEPPKRSEILFSTKQATPKISSYSITPCKFSSSSSKRSTKSSVQKSNNIRQASEHKKVIDFMSENDIFNPDLISKEKLKPPTIGGFLHFVNVLLEKVMLKVDLTQKNYVEKLPEYMKVLRYNGVISKSMLKSVNTVHSWPHVLSLWCWLIDYVESITPKPAEDKVDQKSLNKQLVRNCVFTKYKYFLKNEEQCESEETEINKHIKNFNDSSHFDMNRYNNLKVENEKKKKVQNGLYKEIRDLTEKNESLLKREHYLQNKISNTLMEAKEVKEKFATRFEELKEEENRLKIKQKKHLSEIAKLKETKKSQKYSLQEKEDVLSEIADVKRKMGNVKVRIGDAENLKAIKEKTLTEKLDILHSKIVQWNRSLMDYYCFLDNEMHQQPILEETNLRRESLLSEIQHINALQSKIKDNIKEILKEAEKNNKKLTNEIRRLDDALIKEVKQKKLTELEKDRKQDQLAHLKNKKDKILKDFEEIEAKCISDMQEELKLIETQKENMAALEKAETNLKVELLRKAKNSVKFFEEWAKRAHVEMLEREEIVKKINEEDAALMENLQELLDSINAHADTFLKK